MSTEPNGNCDKELLAPAQAEGETATLSATPAEANQNALPSRVNDAGIIPASVASPWHSYAWYCIRAQQKKEHVAAARLRTIENIEVYYPWLRYQKMTRRGKVWFSEALFPGYLFVWMNLYQHQKTVTFAHGVSGVVQFGRSPNVVPDSAIKELRARVTDGGHEIPSAPIAVGQSVIVTSGTFKGLETLVTQVLPAKQRIKILMDFLGDCREVEISSSEVLGKARHILAA